LGVGSLIDDESKTKESTSSSITKEEDITYKLEDIPSDAIVIQSSDKLINERELLKMNNHYLTNNKRVIIFNNKIKNDPAKIRSSLVRFVAFNNSNKEVLLTLILMRKGSEFNEHIPSGPIISQINMNSTINIYNMHKYDPDKPWSNYDMEVSKVYVNYGSQGNSYGNYGGGNQSTIKISYSGDPRYSGDENGDEAYEVIEEGNN